MRPSDVSCKGCGRDLTVTPHVHQPDGPDAMCFECAGLSMDEYEEMKLATDAKYLTDGKDHATWQTSTHGPWPSKPVGYILVP